MAAFYKDNGSSLFEALIDMYVEHGLFVERLVSVTKKGTAGAEEIQNMMLNFRANPPSNLGGSPVVMVKDFLSEEVKYLETGQHESTQLPGSNVLQFITKDGSIISARPSGTEPKIKFYCSVNTHLESKELYETKSAELEHKIDRILVDLEVK